MGVEKRLGDDQGQNPKNGGRDQNFDHGQSFG